MPPEESYEFVQGTREDLGDGPDTEIDEDQVMGNKEETEG
jgi:hypothetical protein